MAGYTSMSGYSATTTLQDFKGLMQYGDGINKALNYATNACNIDTFAGNLQPMALCTALAPTLPAPIETLAMLHRRWYVQEGDKDILIAASGNKLYAMAKNATEWTELDYPTGVTSYTSNVWSYVCYEINISMETDPVDVILMSNAEDGMIMIRGDTLAVEAVTTPKKFGVITRYAERVFGGAIKDDPDMLVYSTPYDPTNWAQNDDIPEDGAGDIQQPTWDGDGFTALHAFGNQLIAFKKTRVWRILGVNPGEYSFKEQYGGGAPLADTIAVDNERIFMFTRHGAAIYDGLSVSPFQQETCRTTLQKMNLSAIDKACACMFRGKYYCAFPTGESEVNNVVLVYDTLHNTWLTRDDIQPEAFLASSDVLYFTSASTPGQIWTLSEDCWETGQATQGKSTWTTPWIDYGNKTITKGSFEVYLLGEVQSTPVTLTVSLETEKKIKSKLYTIHPTRGDERAPRNERLYFSGDGKRFRLIIQSPENQGVWRLVSSISIVAQVDSE